MTQPTLTQQNLEALNPGTPLNERFTQLKTVIAAHQKARAKQYPDLDLGMRMLHGDMWADGRGWMGPMPPAEDEFAKTVQNAIRDALVSQNIILEVAERARDGIASEECDWSGVLAGADPDKLTDQERTDLEQLEAIMTTWWDESDEDDSTSVVWGELKAALLDCVAGARGVLRMYIPESLVTRDAEGVATVRASNLTEALRLIRLERCDPDTAGIIRRADRTVAGAFFTFLDESGQKRIEWQQREADGTTSVTIERQKGLETAYYKLDRRLLIFEMRASRPLVTPQLVSQQKALNLAHTMAARNTHTAGFLERTILNGEMPGTYVEDKDMPEGKRWVPAPYKTGAGTTNFIAPAQVEDENGRLIGIPASIEYREPTSIEPLEGEVLLAERAALHEARQTHILLQDKATPSSRSRESAISDFKNSVTTPRDQFVAAIRWTLRTAHLLADFIVQASSGTREINLEPRDIRWNVTAPIRAGLANPEDVRVDLELMDAGALSVETVQTRSGRVIDSSAEAARISRERETRPLVGAHAKALEVAGKAIVDGAFPMEYALRLLGVPEAEIPAIIAAKKAELEANGAGL
jgi:hypothetical protein